MLIPKKDLPKNYTTWTNTSISPMDRFPFYLKECGFCNERKFEAGEKRSYSDVLILYSLSGVTRYSKNTSTKFIQPHHVIISACNIPLYFTRSTSQWEFFYIIICGPQSKLFYNLIRTKTDVISINPLTPLLDWFIEIVQTIHINDDLNEMKTSLLIHNILFDLYNITYDIMRAKSHTPVQENDVNKVLNYIGKNYQKELTVDIICHEINFSKFYFCKLFKEHLGISIHQYLNEFRVNKSKELLSYSKLSINSIAAEVGFNNSLTYIRCFKKSMNMTPSEYRNNF